MTWLLVERKTLDKDREATRGFLVILSGMVVLCKRDGSSCHNLGPQPSNLNMIRSGFFLRDLYDSPEINGRPMEECGNTGHGNVNP
jgi:hypothetical protein